VTIETEEKAVIRGARDRGSSLMWCSGCRRKVQMVTPERAAQIAEVSTRTIYRWIEASTVHFVEDSGHLLVCVQTLPLRAPVQDAIGSTRTSGRGEQ